MFYLSVRAKLQAGRLASMVFFIIAISSISAMAYAAEQAEEISENIRSGQDLFHKHCAVCHGSEGAGGVGIPLNMDDFLSTSSDSYLHKTIRLGRPGRIMPAFNTFSEQQVDDIIHYIRSWKPNIKAPIYSTEPIDGDVKKGLAVYDAACSNCHREQGIGAEGTGVTFSRPRDEEILAPAIGNSAFLASAPDQMIKQIIMTGRESTPMDSAASMGIDEQDVNNVVSYLRSLAANNKTNDVLANKTDDAVISFESSYSLEETIENIKQAAQGYNFRYIRSQTLDQGFVDKSQESNKQHLIYFCNFTFLNEALAIDPRIGMFLPFRATIVEKDDTVLVMTVSPDYLCSLFNNNELKQKCDFMADKYEAILEESTL